MEPRSRIAPVPSPDGVHEDTRPVGQDDGPVPQSPFGDDIDVSITDRRWHMAMRDPAREVKRAVRAAMRELGVSGGVSVVLADDRTVQRLNHLHRDRNRPTNVLTFEYAPAGSGAWLWGGDIMLAFPTVAREARAAGRTVRNHMMHLLVHGVLHLSGYDHHHAGDARAMEMEEARILGRMGIPNPWKHRNGRAAGAAR
ncbi:rRNA maturation RNase YbeY [Novacetimonas maltaceti]|uniref:Endoribonuclease YbeY n=1 Tax=Novacetimonas maltaceti TaxID=1203393 RepID=A0A2S3W5K3_9PROT|nr:metal-binding heat shock protein [Novacetimonas maltaceti]PYD61581.1 rRNA maturation RNase YbeY [Novacetimonas maltaceti]